jgi:hypothetical protein
LRWQRHTHQATVRYDLSRFITFADTYHFPEEVIHTFNLIAYNARDLGYHYLQIVPSSLHNVTLAMPSENPVPIQAYLCNGPSCGYPGGCNNFSPNQVLLEIHVDALPARLGIKLWRQKPPTVHALADMLYFIEMN